MTPEIIALKKSYHKARHFSRAAPNSATRRRRCKQARTAYEAAQRSALSRADLLYMTNLSAKDNLVVWAGLTAYTGKKQPPLCPPLGDGRAVTNQQKAQALLGFFASVCAQQSDEDPRWDPVHTAYVREYLSTHAADFYDLAPSTGYNAEFTMNELSLAISKLKTSSPGSDGVPAWFFKHCGASARECILIFVNTSFTNGELPEVCKNADIVPIPKPGRDSTQEKNYRPISLLLMISRLIESMVHRRLYYWAEQNSLIPPTQAAYREYSNSVHPLIRLTQDVRAAFNRSQQTFAVRLDLKKAFDSVNGDYLCFHIHKLGLRGPMLSWVRSFLSDRRYRVVRPTTTEYADFGIGVPQGSGLSPLLFILFISGCSSQLHCSHAEYADDITLWYSGSCPHTIRAMLNADLRAVESWAQRMRLQFGDKNKYFVFHASQTTPIDIEAVGGLQFYSRSLVRDPDFVLLGVHFDHALTFSRHVSQLEASVKRRANMLRCVRAAKLVKNSEALIILYKGWIRPKIEYASEVYGTFATYLANKLEKLQALSLRIILGASKSTPHVILQNEASVSSLASRRRQQCLLTFTKVLALPSNHVLREALQAWRRHDIGFEGPMLRARTFFGSALHAHYELFGCAPPGVLQHEYSNLTLLPPWSVMYFPRRSVDLHMQFRRHLRRRTRESQMTEMRSTPAASWYTSMHPPARRNWLKCLPPGGVFLRVIIRLRSGYTAVGGMLPYLPEQRCELCGAVESVEHFLCHCIGLYSLRARLYDAVSAVTDLPPTVPLLLGFSSSLRSDVLRTITTATARFVVAAKRWP